MKKRLLYNPIQNSEGFIVADFLFAFVLVISISIFIFGITFSLATIEVGQYIVWSTARNFSAGNVSEDNARINAKKKFANLTAKFPLLTGSGVSDPWFQLLDTDLAIGELNMPNVDDDLSSTLSSDDKVNKFRQPWTGARAKIYLKLFAGFQIPFLGKVAFDKEKDFTFPIRAIIIRSPSQADCRNFFYGQRYTEGIKKLENSGGNSALAPTSDASLPAAGNILDGWGEDNGC